MLQKWIYQKIWIMKLYVFDTRKEGGVMVGIADLLDKQAQIITMQTEIINRLAVVVLQHDMIADEELSMMKRASDMIEETEGRL